MNSKTFISVLKILSKKLPEMGYTLPLVERIEKVSKANKEKEFRVFVSAFLSTRTKDEITYKVVNKLFKRIRDFMDIQRIEEKELAEIIKPVGFYKTKAKNLKIIADIFVNKYNGRIPDKMSVLLKLPGVGRKIANLVMLSAFGKYAVCVDTHVHRITNRMGIVHTKNPMQTEMEIRKKIPKRYWNKINYILVMLGQNICKPIKPDCKLCPVSSICEKRV